MQSQEFSGQAATIKYDESKQQVVFEGSEGSLAMLNRMQVPGGKPDTIKAKKITYNRLTGSCTTDGTQVTTFGQ